MPQILRDDELAEGINYLNSKQREVFTVVHTWAKDYVKYNENNIEPIHIFPSGSGGAGKSHLVDVIHNAIIKEYCFITVMTQMYRKVFYLGLQEYKQ